MVRDDERCGIILYNEIREDIWVRASWPVHIRKVPGNRQRRNNLKAWDLADEEF